MLFLYIQKAFLVPRGRRCTVPGIFSQIAINNVGCELAGLPGQPPSPPMALFGTAIDAIDTVGGDGVRTVLMMP